MYKFVGFLLIIIALGGCTDRFKTKEELFKDGQKQMQTGNIGGAIIFFKNALEKDQNYYEARFNLAKAYSLAAKPDLAEKELQKVLRQKPDAREVHIELAKIAIQRNKPEEALKEIGPYLAEGSPSSEVLEIAGMAHALKKDYGNSITYLNRSIALEPGRATAVMALARVEAARGRIKEAKDHLAAFLARDPANRAVLHLLGELELAEGDTESAVKTYSKIIAAYPGDVQASIRIGLIYLDAGRYDDALALADKLIARSGNMAEAHRLKGIVLFQKNRFNDAIASLQKSISIQPSIGAYYFLGLSHVAKNELEQAVSALQKALEASPTFVRGRMALALVYLKKNRSAEAIAECRKALEADEDNAQVYSILGSAYLSQGQYAEGLAAFNRAIEYDPKLAEVRVKKGLFEISRGKSKEAEIELNAAVRVDPDAMNSRVLLATYYSKQGNPEAAIRTLQQGIKGKPSDAVFYSLLGDIYLSQRKPQEALAALKKAKEADPDRDAPYFSLAALHVQKQEYAKAIEELQALVARQPENSRGLIMLGSLMEARGDDGQAYGYFLKAKDAGSPAGYQELAKYSMRKKDGAKAVKILDEAIRKRSTDIGAYELKGRIQMSLQKENDAIRTFEDLERVNPELGFVHIVNAYTAMKKPEKALEKVRKELKKYPDRIELKAEIARLYSMMGRKQDAIDMASQIVKARPDAPMGYLALAQAYASAKDVDRAVEVLRGASSVSDPGLAVVLGDYYAVQANYTAALAQYDKAEKMKASYLPAMAKRAAVLHRMGNRTRAISEYQRVLRVQPNHVPTLNNLAYLYAEEGRDLPQALQYAATAYMQMPRDPFVLDTFGYVLLKNNKADDALKVLTRAAEDMPNNPTILYHLALSYKAQGKDAEAGVHLKKAIDIGEFDDLPAAKALFAKLNATARPPAQ